MRVALVCVLCLVLLFTIVNASPALVEEGGMADLKSTGVLSPTTSPVLPTEVEEEVPIELADPSTQSDLRKLEEISQLTMAEAHAFQQKSDPTIRTLLHAGNSLPASNLMSKGISKVSRAKTVFFEQMANLKSYLWGKEETHNPIAAHTWTGKKIKYTFWNNSFGSLTWGGDTYPETTGSQKLKWKQALTELATHTCVTYEEVSSADFLTLYHSGNAVNHVIVAGNSNRYAAFAGAIGMKHQVQYAGIKATIVSLGASIGIGSIRHELGHLVGMGHTHQRNDATKHLIFHQNLMDDVWANQYIIGRLGIFADSDVAFDYGSLMSYPAWSLAMANETRALQQRLIKNTHYREFRLNGRKMHEYRLLEMKQTSRPDWHKLKKRSYWKRTKRVSMDYRRGGLGQVIGTPQKWTISDIEVVNKLYNCPAKLYSKKHEMLITSKCAAHVCPSTQDYSKAIQVDGHCMNSYVGISLNRRKKRVKKLALMPAVCKWRCMLATPFKTSGCAIPTYPKQML